MRGITLGTLFALSLIAAAAAQAQQQCGQRQVSIRKLIFNGYNAPIGAWPWHGAMFHRFTGGQTTYACGVTIVTERFLITASHCTIDQQERQRMPADRVYVKVGLTDLDSPERFVQQHNVISIVRHDEYDQETFENDIALLKLNTEITFNDYVQPICLWQGDADLRNVVSQVGYIVGWGYDQNYGLPKNLSEATMPIVSRKECIDSDPNYFRKVYFDQKTFCAGYRNGTMAAPGDSGGGLYLQRGNIWVLRGIISNTKSDPNTLRVDPNSFVVLTDTANYLDWIQTNAGGISVGAEPIVSLLSSRPIQPVSRPSSRPSPRPTARLSGNQHNLLAIPNCGKDSYQVGTTEQSKGYENQFPWLAGVMYWEPNYPREEISRGVVVHPSFLITAAHYYQRNFNLQFLSVMLNEYDFFGRGSSSFDRPRTDRIWVSNILVHPNFNEQTRSNNIALLKLRRPSEITPICLPPLGSSSFPTEAEFSLMGWKKDTRSERPAWERTTSTGDGEGSKVDSTVELVDFDSCRQRYADKELDLDTGGSQVCVRYSYGDGSDSCFHHLRTANFQYVQGDRFFLAGIFSFGFKNCQPDEYADVFTNVGHFGEWIREKVRGIDGADSRSRFFR